MHRSSPILFILFSLAMIVPSSSRAQLPPEYDDTPTESTRGPLGIRGGLGTDVSLGLGFGFGASWLVRPATMDAAIDVGLELYLANVSESTDEGGNTYEEETSLRVFAVRINGMWDYDPDVSQAYYVAGTGAASVAVEWEERSDTDTSLGTPLPGGGSMQSEDGTVGAAIVNFGIGRTFGNGADVRLETPILIFLSGVGDATTFAPTVTLTAGYRF